MRSSGTRAAAHMRSTASGGAAEQQGRRDPSRCTIFSMKIYFQTVLFGIIKPAARAAAFTPKTCTPPSSHSCRAAVRLPCARALYNQWGCHFNSYDQAIFYQHVDALAYTLWGWVDSDTQTGQPILILTAPIRVTLFCSTAALFLGSLASRTVCHLERTLEHCDSLLRLLALVSTNGSWEGG